MPQNNRYCTDFQSKCCMFHRRSQLSVQVQATLTLLAITLLFRDMTFSLTYKLKYNTDGISDMAEYKTVAVILQGHKS